VYFSPDRGAARTLIGFIDRVEHSLDFAIYSFTHEYIADAIIRAHERKVVIRGLLDNTQASSKHSQHKRLIEAGVVIRLDKSSSAMHAKYAVADGHRPGKWAVANGSFNWSVNADERNVEHLVIIRLKKTVDEFSQHFEEIWRLNTPTS
jgi:phosphatidylserine/phosphatidylglycerophosphate/cardiolipin synthase-like enzyme